MNKNLSFLFVSVWLKGALRSNKDTSDGASETSQRAGHCSPECPCRPKEANKETLYRSR